MIPVIQHTWMIWLWLWPIIAISWWLLPQFIELMRYDKKPNLPPPNPAVDLVVDLIKMGKDWQITSHTWFHPTGVCIWTSNGAKYISANLNATDNHDWCDGNQARKTTQRPLKLTDAERQRIWQAIITQPDHQNTDAVAALAGRIMAMYEDKAQ